MITACFRTMVLAICFLGFSPAFAQKVAPYGGSKKFKKLVWSDEFNYTGLPDSNRWSNEEGYIRNKELQFYTRQRKENAFVKNGLLTISALNDSLSINNKIVPVTSASLRTKGKQDWTYGRVEVKAKIPTSLGTWPAIWMLGSDLNKVGWPACGEIDILEHVGYMPETIHFNVHTKKYNHVKKTGKGTTLNYTGVYNEFHVYAIEWFDDHIDWYFDNKKVFTYANEGEGADSWPFNKPQYLIINLAFGGAWGGQKGVDLASLPQQFMIDYVRVFQ